MQRTVKKQHTNVPEGGEQHTRSFYALNSPLSGTIDTPTNYSVGLLPTAIHICPFQGLLPNINYYLTTKNRFNMRYLFMLCLQFFTFSLLGQDTIHYDFDKDKKKDKLFVLDNKGYQLSYTLSSQKQKAAKSLLFGTELNVDDFILNKEIIELLLYDENGRYKFKFRYNAALKDFQLIGYDSYSKGNLVGDGTGISSYNLINGNYWAKWEYYDYYQKSQFSYPEFKQKIPIKTYLMKNFGDKIIQEIGLLDRHSYSSVQKNLSNKTVQKHSAKRTLKDTLTILNSLIHQKYPKNEIIDIVKGDINLDKLEDMVVVTEKLCSDEEGFDNKNNRCRTVFFIVQTKPNNYEIKASNKAIIGCSTCGGANIVDPYLVPEIKKNKIIFYHISGAWERTEIVSTFVYDKAKKNWFLMSSRFCTYIPAETDCKMEEKTPKNFGIISFNQFDGTEW